MIMNRLTLPVLAPLKAAGVPKASAEGSSLWRPLPSVHAGAAPLGYSGKNRTCGVVCSAMLLCALQVRSEIPNGFGSNLLIAAALLYTNVITA